MSIRTLKYTVTVDGILPATEQFAGTQGDKNVTEVIFDLLDIKLNISDKNGLYYRFDGYDAEGNILRGDSYELAELSSVKFVLPEELTRHGGKICVYLIITKIIENENGQETEMELYCFPARMRLNSLPSGVDIEGEGESFTTLAESAKSAADRAEAAAASIADIDEVFSPESKNPQSGKAIASALVPYISFEDDTVWIFDGGDAEGNVDLDNDGEKEFSIADIRLVIDDEMSDTSGNLVRNKTITEHIKNEIESAKRYAVNEAEKVKLTIDSEISDASENVVMNKAIKKYIDEMKVIILSEAHPVGSYYWSSDGTNPAGLFGGEWEQVKDKFVLAVGDNYAVGTSGGEATHTLTLDETPMTKYSDYRPAANTDIALDNHKIVSYDTNKTVTSHNNMPPYEVAYCWKRIS